MRDRCFLSVAGITVCIDADQPLIRNREFAPFVVAQTSCDIYAVFRAADMLPPVPQHVLFSANSSRIAEDSNGNYQKFFFENSNDPVHYAVAVYEQGGKQIRVDYLKAYEHCVSELKNCFFHLGFETILLQYSKLCFHASCVDTAYGGILFSGISGIGKSTQADLWCKHRAAKQINGDRPILSKDACEWRAWGSPYAGSSECHVNDSCRISAIVLLKQDAVCSVRRLGPSEAFRKVWSGMTVHSWDKAYVDIASILTMDLISVIPVFELACTPDENAITCLEQVLRKEYHL